MILSRISMSLIVSLSPFIVVDNWCLGPNSEDFEDSACSDADARAGTSFYSNIYVIYTSRMHHPTLAILLINSI
jgi:hypothetical protein